MAADLAEAASVAELRMAEAALRPMATADMGATTEAMAAGVTVVEAMAAEVTGTTLTAMAASRALTAQAWRKLGLWVLSRRLR
jgi:hypothetical protein